jgi:hypothetical protein
MSTHLRRRNTIDAVVDAFWSLSGDLTGGILRRRDAGDAGEDGAFIHECLNPVVQPPRFLFLVSPKPFSEI